MFCMVSLEKRVCVVLVDGGARQVEKRLKNVVPYMLS